MRIFRQKRTECFSVPASPLSPQQIDDFREDILSTIEYYKCCIDNYQEKMDAKRAILEAFDIGLKTITTKENNNEK